MRAKNGSFWDRFEDFTGPFSFERLVTVSIALAGLLTAMVAYLQINASANGNAAARNTERYAVLSATQNVTGLARTNYDYYGAFRVWQDINYQAVQSLLNGDPARAELQRKTRDALADLTPLLQSQYTSGLDEVLPGYYIGTVDRYLYEADLYSNAAADTGERYAIASRQRDAWSAKGTQYVRMLAFLGVSLLLLGLSTPLPRAFRAAFYGLGTVVALGALYTVAGVYFDEVPTVSEAAIGHYAEGATWVDKSFDKKDLVNNGIDSFSAAIVAQPDYGHAYLARADAYVSRAGSETSKDASAANKDYQAALADYETAIKHSDDDIPTRRQALVSRGQTLYQLGRLDDAVKMDREALKLNPNQASVRYALALALLAKGDTNGAELEYARAVNDTHEGVETAVARGDYPALLFFDLDRAALRIQYLKDRIDKGDRGGGTAPPLNSIPEAKRDEIYDKGTDLYALLRSEAIAVSRKPPEQLGAMPAAKVTDVVFGAKRDDGGIDRRRAFGSKTREVTLQVSFTGLQPGQRLSVRVYDSGFEVQQMRQDVAWSGPANGVYQVDLSYPGKLISFTPGTHTAEVFIENHLVGTGSFNIDFQ